jgi:hypothetical protein
MPRPDGQIERKRRLLDALRARVKRDGAVPGLSKFLQEIDEKKHTFQGTLWASWGDFVREAGFEVGEFKQAIPDAALLGALADLTRRQGKFPTSAQLRYAGNNDANFPHESTLRNRFGGQSEMATRLREWLTDKPEYLDVLQVLGNIPVQTVSADAGGCATTLRETAEGTGLSDSYVPPVVASLPGMASADPDVEQACRDRGVDLNVEFERRVGVAFRLLGFDVEGLGQGGGRVADGIARCTSGRWAVVYDAKVRRTGFALGTEDRKFREYLERHAPDLQRGGIESVYFAVVSNSFDKADVDKAREVVRLTKAKAFVLLEARALRALVDIKLRTRLLEDWAALERLLLSPGILGVERVGALER